MLVREAKWYRDQLAAISPDELFPLLNVGSHTEDYRRFGQPWIDRYVFAPLRPQAGEVVHTDIRAAAGVDIVGNLLEPSFRDELRTHRFRGAICSNLLEHVTQREAIATTVAEVVEPGGHLLVSCPHRFPYHPDPIDTMYRPDVEELAALFPGTRIVRGEVLRCGNLSSYIAARMIHCPAGFAKQAMQDPGEENEPSPVKKSSRLTLLPWLIRPFYATCIVLRKEGQS